MKAATYVEYHGFNRNCFAQMVNECGKLHFINECNIFCLPAIFHSFKFCVRLDMVMFHEASLICLYDSKHWQRCHCSS